MLEYDLVNEKIVWTHSYPEGIDSIFDHFRTVQAEEAWASLGNWVETVKPRFGPGIGECLADRPVP